MLTQAVENNYSNWHKRKIKKHLIGILSFVYIAKYKTTKGLVGSGIKSKI